MRPADNPEQRKRDPHLLLGPLTFLSVLAIMLASGAFLLSNAVTPEITVPDLTGRPFEQAVADLKKQGFTVEISPTPQTDRESWPVGTVIRTSPVAGSRVKTGRLIAVFVSADNAMIAVPDLTGLMLLDAENMLGRAGLGSPGAGGLMVGRKTWQTVDSPAGTILSQTPEAGVMVKSGSPVDLVIAVSEAADSMPNLVGMMLTEALDLLASKGCLADTVEPYFTTTKPANTSPYTTPVKTAHRDRRASAISRRNSATVAAITMPRRSTHQLTQLRKRR